MSFVEVQDAGTHAEREEGAVTSGAQDQLLKEPGAQVAAVEAEREDVAVGRRRIARPIEQQEARPADARQPEIDREGARGGLELDPETLAPSVEERLERHAPEVQVDVVLLLSAVLVEALREVPLAVEDRHAPDRHAQVGAALEMIAGQDPQPARVDRQGLVQAELGGEVGDRTGIERGGVAARPVTARLDIGPQRSCGVFEGRAVRGVAGARLDPDILHLGQERGRAVVDAPPEVGVDLPEERIELPAPCPAEVAGQLGEEPPGLRHARSWGTVLMRPL